MHQPAWSEPSREALVTQLKRLYAERQDMAAGRGRREEQLSAHVRSRTWFHAGSGMLRRLQALLEARRQMWNVAPVDSKWS